MGTISTNLGLQIPTVAADADTWGDQLNFSLNTIDDIFQTGGTAISLGDVTTDDFSYLGSLTGSTGIINIGSGQIYKDVAGNVGIGTSTPNSKLQVSGNIASGDGSSSLPSITFGADLNTGFWRPTTDTLAASTGGLERLRIDSAGNLGLGVVPSAWGNGARALQIGSVGSVFQNPAGSVLVGRNHYVDATNASIYSTTGFATRYFQNAVGDHSWSVAPSGTAGNPITFTQAMTLTNGGNLLVGGTVDFGETLQIGAPADPESTFVRLSNGGFATLVAHNSAVSHIYSNSSNRGLAFGTNSIERARITSGGYFKASNTGTYQAASAIRHEFNNDANEIVLLNTSTSTGSSVSCVGALLPSGAAGNQYIGILNGTTVYQVLANGNVQNTNNSYGALSDQKLKENVTDATPKLENLNKLRVVNYNLIGDDLKQIGLIAQEVEQVFPALVDSTPDLDEEGQETGEVTKSIKYSVLVPMLLKAVQELSAEVADLKSKLA